MAKEKILRKNKRLPVYTCVVLCIIIILTTVFVIQNHGLGEVAAALKSNPPSPAMDGMEAAKIPAIVVLEPEAKEKEEEKRNKDGEKPVKEGETAREQHGGENRVQEAAAGAEPVKYAVSVEDAYVRDGNKVAYLTFDDGPTENITPHILDVLAKYEVKATFFVLGKLAEANPELLRREVREGHAIGNHSYSHVYKQIYASSDSLMQEVKKTEQVLKEILGDGFSTRVFRFPGGSFDTYKQPMKEVLKEKGYVYVDWNTVNGDEEIKNPSADALFNKVKETAGAKEKLVVLMHDSANKQTTLQSLPRVIEYLKAQGYAFKTLK